MVSASFCVPGSLSTVASRPPRTEAPTRCCSIPPQSLAKISLHVSTPRRCPDSRLLFRGLRRIQGLAWEVNHLPTRDTALHLVSSTVSLVFQTGGSAGASEDCVSLLSFLSRLMAILPSLSLHPSPSLTSSLGGACGSSSSPQGTFTPYLGAVLAGPGVKREGGGDGESIR